MDRATAQRLNAELGGHIESLQEIGKKLQSLIPKRATLLAQLSENDMVKKEFDKLGSDATVYKLSGPVLVKQDVSDAKVNVMNRIKFFQAEIDRIDASEKDLTEQQKKHKDEIMKIQETAKQLQQAAVAKQTGGKMAEAQ